MKLLTSIALCISLVVPSTASEPEPEFEPAAGYAVGAVVVCVGGYCIYKMVKVCQKLFPPKKSGETNSNGGFSATSNDEYAGAYEYSSIGSCYIPDSRFRASSDNSNNATTFMINIKLEPSGASISMSANQDAAATQTWDQFVSEMAEHGLILTGHATYQPQFSRNHIPCDGASIPLSFDEVTGRVINNTGSAMKRVTVERSIDLKDWYPFLVTDTGEGSALRIVDTTRDGQMFYRVAVSQP